MNKRNIYLSSDDETMNEMGMALLEVSMTYFYLAKYKWICILLALNFCLLNMSCHSDTTSSDTTTAPSKTGPNDSNNSDDNGTPPPASPPSQDDGSDNSGETSDEEEANTNFPEEYKQVHGYVHYEWNSQNFPVRLAEVSLFFADITGAETSVQTATDLTGYYSYSYNADLTLNKVLVRAISDSTLIFSEHLTNCNTNSWYIASLNDWLYENGIYVRISYTLSEDDKLNDNLELNIDPSLETGFASSDVSGVDYVHDGFHVLDMALASMEFVCSVEPTYSFPALSIYKSDSEEISFYGDDQIIMKKSLDEPLLYSGSVAHEYAHYLQDHWYTRRDYDVLRTRGATSLHDLTSPYDARYSFFEGFAAGFGDSVVHFFYTDVVEVPNYSSSSLDYASGIWSDQNVGYLIRRFIDDLGYGSVHDIYKNLSDTPVFQTLHAFAYYAKQNLSLNQTLEDDLAFIGLSTECLEDLYDTHNYMGREYGSALALYPYMHYNVIETDDDATDSAGVIIDKDNSGDRYFQFDFNLFCTDADFNGDPEMEILSSDDLCLALFPMHDFTEYNQIYFDFDNRFASQHASRWFRLVSEQTLKYTYTTAEGEKITGWVPLKIADDDADCGKEFYLNVYKDGELYTSANGYCPQVDIQEDGNYILEVYSMEESIDNLVDCFAFLDERFCHDHGYY